MRLSGRKQLSFTRHWTQQSRVVLLTLLGLNIAIFVAQLFLEASRPGFIHDYLGISDRGVRDAYTWQFVIAPLLHNGPWHLLGNMLILFVLGRDLETILGQRHLLYLYLAGSFARRTRSSFLALRLCPVCGFGWRGCRPSCLRDNSSGTGTRFNRVFLVPLRLKAKASRLRSVCLGVDIGLYRSRRHGSPQRLPRRVRGRMALRASFGIWTAINLAANHLATPCGGRTLPADGCRTVHGRGN